MQKNKKQIYHPNLSEVSDVSLLSAETNQYKGSLWLSSSIDFTANLLSEVIYSLETHLLAHTH